LIGKRLKKLRKERNISQEELGKILDMTTSSIGHYEIDSKNPSYEILVKIAKYFAVTTDYLLGLTNNANENINVPRDYAVVVSSALEQNISADRLKELIEFAKSWQDK
jgi:transcriptional regulator with XRE-family HTH domain